MTGSSAPELSPNMWTTSQPTRVFGWSNILSDWNTLNFKPEEISTVLDNLTNTDCPTQHFLTYFNDEQDGLKWFLYECIASSWMWDGYPQMKHIEAVVPLVEMNARFPAFPGAPRGTVKQFLTRSLDTHQLENLFPAPSPRFGQVRFHIIRSLQAESEDDWITIRKEGEDRYSYTYKEAASASKCHKTTFTHSLDGEQVLTMLRTTFKLLTLDSQPFHSLQVMLPTTPTVLIPIEDLNSSARDVLYDSVEVLMDSWPEVL